MPVACGVGLTRLGQLRGRVLADRLEQPVANLLVPRFHYYQGLLHQEGQNIEAPAVAVPGWRACSLTSQYGGRGFQIEMTREHGQLPQGALLLFRKQVMAPVQGSPQSPMPGFSGAGSAGQQGE